MKNGHCSKKLVDASESLYLSLKKSNYLVEYKKKLFSNLGGWGWTGLQGRISAHQLVMGSLLVTTRNISPKRRLLRGSLPRLRFWQDMDQLPQHLRSTHIPSCLHIWHHLRRLRSPAHLRPRASAAPPQVRRGRRRQTLG